MNLTNNKIEFDKDLAKLVSYLTFDGHLAKDLSCFYLSSKNKEMLSDFADLVYNKFKINGRLKRGTGYGESYKYRVFKKNVCKLLEEIGVPKGSKVIKIFLIPMWILENKECCREYLKTAFDCEGSIWFEDKPKIRFGICKAEQLISNGKIFLEQMKLMLSRFNIDSTKTWLIKGNLRKDGNLTKGLYFKIKQSSIKQFALEIGFNDRFKNQRLSSI
ncbi:MAG: hypothetical protein KKF46_01305 [Nanoarchaeota archaeon]|nr:hypothetical protein [Nanoarchaeota archaeon]MBU1320971.1 hypothetical protein [Nanoarchaeota archaeon]MBU1598356.1 hypothetical protein [Nanoarchaeota archaeon]MBU2441742.1 hypothetical protein [Nanoarchaeota archaeon]